MNFWDLKKIVSRIIPRKSLLEKSKKANIIIKAWGRKENLKEFNFESREFKPYGRERILPKDIIYGFTEVSVRACHCPMPLNMDVYSPATTGCQYKCLYCFVQNYSSSLYHSFYDNWKEVGLRYCNSDFFKVELEKHMRFRGCKPNENASDIQKAFHLGIPARLGIRTENFIPIEKKMRIAYEMLKYLSDLEYPVMINTKSNLLKEEDYVRVLADNKAKAAVHMTLISSDNELLKQLEPGAPNFDERLEACKILIEAGIRVVARIEPFMCFINDDKEKVDEYIEKIKSVGIKNITLDTYSYSASAPGLRKNFENVGFDFDRMFYTMSELQWLGSLLLTKFMEYLQSKELSCSTFDYGSSTINTQNVCCEVGDFFDTGFNYGSTIMAIRFIQSKKGMPVTWKEYVEYVESKGGFLSNAWKRKVQMAWNMIGNIAEVAYFPYWAQGIFPIGLDSSMNRIWIYREDNDFRKEMLNILIN